MKIRMFTLIELLIVVGIIAILAALLLPVLSRAKYSARLVVCMNNQKQVVAGTAVYTTDNNTRYPMRHGIEILDKNHAFPNRLDSRYWPDDRLHIDPYVSLDDLKCPFSDPQPVMNQVIGVNGLEAVMTSYALYFGFIWSGEKSGLKRLGKQMTFKGDAFDILVSDLNIYYTNIRTWNSHPDAKSGSLILSDWVPNSTKYDFKSWNSYETHFRGPLDLNFGRQDGSVFRISKVTYNDSRLKQVPYKYNNDSKSVAQRGSLVPSVDYGDQ